MIMSSQRLPELDNELLEAAKKAQEVKMLKNLWVFNVSEEVRGGDGDLRPANRQPARAHQDS